jgi:hypothetical protein
VFVTSALQSFVLIATTAALVLMLLYHLLLHVRASARRTMRDAEIAAWFKEKSERLPFPSIVAAAAKDDAASTAAVKEAEPPAEAAAAADEEELTSTGSPRAAKKKKSGRAARNGSPGSVELASL